MINKRIYKNPNETGRYLGDYVSLTNEHAHLIDAELIWCEMRKKAREFCEKAKVEPYRIQMVVTFYRAAVRAGEEEERIIRIQPQADDPIMTIGWKVYLTKEEMDNLSIEYLASICGGIYVKEE